MKKIKFNLDAVSIIIIIVFITFSFFYLNNSVIPNNYSNQNGGNIWLSSSTIKFTNNWLKEGPIKLNFIMYEAPDSIEFNDLNSREPYISYPSGCILPPYIIAKILGKTEIGISFIKHMVEAKFLLDSILIGIIIYSVLTYLLKLKFKKMNTFISIIISMFWMILPNNLYYLKNIYFSDQLIITVVLLFVLFEIYNSFFKEHKNKIIKNVYYILKFLIVLYGVLVDYYFLFVAFIAFLVEIVPIIYNLIKNKGFKIIIILKESAIYVLPVVTGLIIFLLQIINVENFMNILIDKAKFRLSTTSEAFDVNLAIYKNFVDAYGKTGVAFIFVILFMIIVLALINLISYLKNIEKKDEVLNKLVKLGLIIYIPPIMQILILRNHSAIHEFSTLKFGLPFVFGIIILAYAVFKISKVSLNSSLIINMDFEEEKKYVKVSFFGLFILISMISVISTRDIKNRIMHYYNYRNSGNITYELENIMKEKSQYEDVFFSYTYEIKTNPPMNLSVSNKLVYKIGEFSDISEKFPNLNKSANILFVIEKDNFNKDKELVKKENDIINNSNLMFESENYYIYKLKEDLK